MKIQKAFNAVVQYFVDAIARIFGLNDDQYPNIGIQPFDGDPYGKSHSVDS